MAGVPGAENYLRMIGFKTGDLFRAAIAIGGMLGCANSSQLACLDSYMSKAARAFQLQDDILDIEESADKGHEFGSDIRQGKLTLLASSALNNATADEAQALRNLLLGNVERTPKQIKEAAAIIRKYGIPTVKEQIDSLIRDSTQALSQPEKVLNNDGVRFFSQLALLLVNRNS